MLPFRDAPATTALADGLAVTLTCGPHCIKYQWWGGRTLRSNKARFETSHGLAVAIDFLQT